MKEKIAATIVIHRAAGMSDRGRRSIASWMRRTAKHFETKPKTLAARFIARYYYL